MNRITLRRLSLLAFLALTIMVGSALADSGAVGQSLLAPVVNDAVNCTVVVNAGQKIQTALDSAQSGAAICVRTGVYHEEVTLSHQKPGIILMAYPGDKPVLDGQNNLPTKTYQGLIQVNASDAIVDGFEVRNSDARGIVVAQYGQSNQPIRNVTIRNNIVRDSWDMGIIVNGSEAQDAENILIENNAVYDNLRINSGTHEGGSGLLFIETKNSTARGNVVYNNLGEGLVAGRWTTNIVLEDNVVYDNKHANIYLSTTINPLVRRNLVFCTDDRAFWRVNKPKPAPGITLRDESYPKQSVKPPPSQGQVIINNIVVGCGNNLWVATQITGGGLNGAVIANNTFVNARGDNGSGPNNVLIEGNVSLQNSRFVNNLILQSVAGAASAHLLVNLGTPNMSTFTLADNLYSVAPSKSWPGGESGRIVGDPKLTNPAMPVNGSVPDANGYRLRQDSPAINAGTGVSQVTEDFFKESRNGALDIGADEYGGSAPPTTGRILVVTATTPERSSQSFSFTASYAPGGFQLTDGQTHDSGQLNPGNYSVAMTPVSGWLTSADCSDGSQPESIALSAGETVTCTFASEEQSVPATRITVIKQTIPANDPQSFMFASNFAGAFSLTHNGQESADVEPGVYQVSETVPTGWVQDSATCSDGSTPDSINVTQGEAVTCTFVNRKESPGGGGDLNATVYLATYQPGNVGGVDYNKGDIVAYDGLIGAWSLFFDGSDVGINKPINDFAIVANGSPNPTILMVLNGSINLNGPGGAFTSLMSDVVQFNPTSLGDTTSGSWELYFDGSDVDLSSSAEKIDSLALKSDGTLLISTYGKASVKNSGQTVIAMDEDLLAFAPTSTGTNTSGVWSLELDGSTISGLKAEDITALWHDSATGTHYITLMSDFIVGGQSGNSGTILAIPATGAPFVFWDAADAGYAGPIDGLHIELTP